MAVPTADAELCSGRGLCETICPEVFELGDDGLADILDASDCDEAGCCEETAESCPDEAITPSE